MTDPTEAQILSALDQSGYLFEQQVADRLEIHEFHVETSWAFNDPDQEKSRELEQSAPREYVFPYSKVRTQKGTLSFREVPTFIHHSLSSQHYYYKEKLKATQFIKMARKGKEWTANHEGVYDALILPLAKAAEAQRQDAARYSSGDWKHVWLIFPMVVLRERLFALDVSQSQRSLKPSGRISFVRHLESGNVKGFCLTDFVTFSYLDKYINDEVMPFVEHVSDLCKQKPSPLLRRDA